MTEYQVPEPVYRAVRLAASDELTSRVRAAVEAMCERWEAGRERVFREADIIEVALVAGTVAGSAHFVRDIMASPVDERLEDLIAAFGQEIARRREGVCAHCGRSTTQEQQSTDTLP